MVRKRGECVLGESEGDWGEGSGMCMCGEDGDSDSGGIVVIVVVGMSEKRNAVGGVNGKKVMKSVFVGWNDDGVTCVK